MCINKPTPDVEYLNTQHQYGYNGNYDKAVTGVGGLYDKRAEVKKYTNAKIGRAHV